MFNLNVPVGRVVKMVSVDGVRTGHWQCTGFARIAYPVAMPTTLGGGKSPPAEVTRACCLACAGRAAMARPTSRGDGSGANCCRTIRAENLAAERGVDAAGRVEGREGGGARGWVQGCGVRRGGKREPRWHPLRSSGKHVRLHRGRSTQGDVSCSCVSCSKKVAGKKGENYGEWQLNHRKIHFSVELDKERGSKYVRATFL